MLFSLLVLVLLLGDAGAGTASQDAMGGREGAGHEDRALRSLSVMAAGGWRLLSLVLPTCIVFNAAKQVPKCAVDQRRRQGSVVRLGRRLLGRTRCWLV